MSEGLIICFECNEPRKGGGGVRGWGLAFIVLGDKARLLTKTHLMVQGLSLV